VLAYNTTIATVPSSIIAGMFGFARRDFFDAGPEAQAVPEVKLR